MRIWSENFLEMISNGQKSDEILAFLFQCKLITIKYVFNKNYWICFTVLLLLFYMISNNTAIWTRLYLSFTLFIYLYTMRLYRFSAFWHFKRFKCWIAQSSTCTEQKYHQTCFWIDRNLVVFTYFLHIAGHFSQIKKKIYITRMVGHNKIWAFWISWIL